MDDEICFIIVRNYPSKRRFVIKKPLKKTALDSLAEIFFKKT